VAAELPAATPEPPVMLANAGDVVAVVERLGAEDRHAAERAASLAVEADRMRALVRARGRAYVKAARAGLLPAGGIKVIRFVVLFKQVGIHIHRLIHPQAIRRMKLDGHPLPDLVVEAVGGFFAVYIVMFFVFMAFAMMDGMDQVTAFGAVAATISNLGPGLGDVAITFADVSAHGKVMFAIAMLFGRLEIYTFLVLLTPAFWRR
jgi:hypothetical protein